MKHTHKHCLLASLPHNFGKKKREKMGWGWGGGGEQQQAAMARVYGGYMRTSVPFCVRYTCTERDVDKSRSRIFLFLFQNSGLDTSSKVAQSTWR